MRTRTTTRHHARARHGSPTPRRRVTSRLAIAALVTAALSLGSVAAAAGPPDSQPLVTDGAVTDPIERPPEPVPGQYIVTLREPAPAAGQAPSTPAPSPSESHAAVEAQAADLADRYGGTVLVTFATALSGFGVRMSDAEARALSQDPAVASVAQDGYVHALATQWPATWGLDRVDQRDLPLDGAFTYASDGARTTVYVIDSGIRTDHEDFEGRAYVGADFVGDGRNGQDCAGHGTRVASVVGGRTWGVAKNVTLVSVRVLGCNGTGTTLNVIAGIDWVTAHHESPAVANVSIGAPSNPAENAAVANSIASGVTYVVAAGNDGDDACNHSPASAAGVITVGATDASDRRASFSDVGPCVALFAPGVGITAASNGTNTATETRQGTSYSSPHVAGIAAAFLNSNPSATPAQVRAALIGNASNGRVTDPGPGSPNALAFSGFIGAPPPGPTTPVSRIFGADAIDTSLAISQAMFGSGGASALVLARSDHFADALAGGPLAARVAGPLLITPGAGIQSGLDPRVRAEIQRVLPSGRSVYVLGGELALGPAIDTELRALGYTVVRVWGANQFSTAVAIADRLGNPPVVFEATGLNFADALSAVPAAIQAGGAILLTNGSVQAPETAAYLAAHPPSTRYAIGGPLAAAGADPLAIPVYGADLFATSAVVANRFFRNATAFGAATGLNFPDALAGGVFMGAPGHVGPVLLVAGSGPVPTGIAAYLTRTDTTARGYLFGGPLAVGPDVASELGRL